MDINCPFCNESGFDQGGLAYHLKIYCEEFDNSYQEHIKNPSDEEETK